MVTRRPNRRNHCMRADFEIKLAFRNFTWELMWAGNQQRALGDTLRTLLHFSRDPYQGLRASESVQDVIDATHDVLNFPAMARLHKDLGDDDYCLWG